MQAHPGNGELLGEEKIQVGLEHFLLSSGEEATSIVLFAENAQEEWGYSTFALVEANRGIEVADAACCAEDAHNNRIRYSELQEAI